MDFISFGCWLVFIFIFFFFYFFALLKLHIEHFIDLSASKLCCNLNELLMSEKKNAFGILYNFIDTVLNCIFVSISLIFECFIHFKLIVFSLSFFWYQIHLINNEREKKPLHLNKRIIPGKRPPVIFSAFIICEIKKTTHNKFISQIVKLNW